MLKYLMIALCVFGAFNSFANIQKLTEKKAAFFSGRIAKMNEPSGLVRVKVQFENFKFLNKKDRVEFWAESDPTRRCLSYIEARSSQYMLIKIPEYGLCVKSVFFTTGSHLMFYSPDLERNLMVARELVDILLKKRLALDARKGKLQRDLDIYTNKQEAINKRFEILRQKLELEWFRELSALDADKAKTFTDFKNTEARLDEIDHKLQIYKVKEDNFRKDRWSLDEHLYIKK